VLRTLPAAGAAQARAGALKQSHSCMPAGGLQWQLQASACFFNCQPGIHTCLHILVAHMYCVTAWAGEQAIIEGASRKHLHAVWNHVLHYITP
jgi:hypothetical protein